MLAAAPAAAAVGALLAWRLPAAPARAAHRTEHHPAGTDAWWAFAVLSAVTMARSVVFIGLYSFLAFLWMSRYRASEVGGSLVLAEYLGAGLAGTLAGGWLGDRVGHRAIVRGGFAGAVVLLEALLHAPSAGWAAGLLVLLAVCFALPSSVLVVLGQEYLPTRHGMASGVTLGLAVSVGGMAAPPLGWVADRHGIGSVFLVLEVVLAVAAGLTFLLPRPPGVSMSGAVPPSEGGK